MLYYIFGCLIGYIIATIQNGKRSWCYDRNVIHYKGNIYEVIKKRNPYDLNENETPKT